MDVSHIFDELNDAQREAVAAAPQPLLVLAGAGSGKTRVLISRIAYLVEAHEVSPYRGYARHSDGRHVDWNLS